jgi:ribosomal subunit interface protein
MQLPVQISFHEVPHSDAIDAYVRKRADKLDVMAPRLTSCRVVVDLPHKHARHGEHYRVRVDVTTPGGEVVVTRSPDDARTYEDVFAAIDAAFDDLGRQLQDFVRRRRGDVKPHEKARHGQVIKVFTYEGYGFLRTEEGEELYWVRLHRDEHVAL